MIAQTQNKISAYTKPDGTHCKTYKDKVEFLYLHYQDAVNHDNNLLMRYAEHFEATNGREDVIKRTGRAVRALERKKGIDARFMREKAFKRLSKEQERKEREKWRKFK